MIGFKPELHTASKLEQVREFVKRGSLRIPENNCTDMMTKNGNQQPRNTPRTTTPVFVSFILLLKLSFSLESFDMHFACFLAIENIQTYR